MLTKVDMRQLRHFGLDTILNVPITRKELSWQLGEGGWKLSRLRFLLACGLVGRRFEHPYKDFHLNKSIVN